jgi:glycosyltransferase involved in cell wall biosynthesis
VRAVRRIRPDVLHANLRVPASCWYGILGGLLAPGTRTLAVEQLPIAIEQPWARLVTRLLDRRLDAHVAVGEESARRTERFVGLPHGSVASIPNHVPDPGPVAQAPHDGVHLVAVGRLDAQKAFDVLLAALTTAELEDVTLELVGDGALRIDLERQTADLGLGERVTFAGWADDVRAHLARADVFVLPSRSEGFPLSVVEAMLAGLPVVATPVGSVPEAVADGDTGLLVAKDDPRALAAALAKLAHDPGLRRRMGAAGRARAAHEFTVARMAAAYEALYRDLVA